MDQELKDLKAQKNISPWRLELASWVESNKIQALITITIVINAIILGLETSADLMASYGTILISLDKICLAIFIIELGIKLIAYRGRFWRSPWNIFDFLVVSVALVPGAGPWAVLRTLRVLRVLRLLTVVPSLRIVVAAFLHSIPGLSGVAAVMTIFFYTAAVLATRLFGESFPEWFGSISASLYTLFQVMTLEGWSMALVRPIMETYPYAWLFFVPFIIIATFTILNLFIGIIVSTMQELSIPPEKQPSNESVDELLKKLEGNIEELRAKIKKDKS